MYQTPEQLIALNKAHVEAAMRLAGVALQGVEKLVELQMSAARTALTEGANNVRALAAVKDPQDLAALRNGLQPGIEKATAWARDVYAVAANTQAEMQKLVESQLTDFNKSVVSQLEQVAKKAPAGSEYAINALRASVAATSTAFENVATVARQVRKVTEANMAAATPNPASRKKAA